MKADTLVFDNSTFGITEKSFKMLRNAIVDNLHDEILVIEIPTGGITCGFLLLNKTKNSATWSGDGFRHDRGGEGGRGYVSAHKMLDMFGLQYSNIFTEGTIQSFKDALICSEDKLERALLRASNRIAEEFEDDEYICVYNIAPCY